MARALSSGALAFLIAIFVSAPAQGAIAEVHPYIAFPILLSIILVGVFFDVLGVAAAAADEKPFHAMSAKRIPGARQAMLLVRRADRVSSFANDIMGDIAASLSGAVGVSIVFRLARGGFSEELTGTLVLGLIAFLTVGGKAAMKSVAMRRANDIIFALGKVVHWVERLVHIRLLGGDRPAGRR